MGETSRSLLSPSSLSQHSAAGVCSPSAGRTPLTSTRPTHRRILGLSALVITLVALVFLSLVLGARTTSLAETWNAWPRAWELLRTNQPAAADDEVAGILATMRIPRTVVAIVVGAALSLAGTLVQGLTRNPLADPGILGVNSGAALAITSGLYFFGIISIPGQLLLAFCGAGLAALIVFGLTASGTGKGNTLSLVLSGTALAAVLGALTAAVVYIDPNALDSLRFWQAGSVAGRGFDIILPALVPLAVGTALALALGPTLNVLSLGADTAQGLGVNVGRSYALGLLAIAVLAGAATAVAGPISFVGLVVPHIARSITGHNYLWILPYAALAGACLVLAADIVGRLVVRPGELQAGIVVALLGGPAFVWLIRHREMVNL